MSKNKLILMSGLPGSGKSTLAEAVAQKLQLPIFSVDPIESAIIKSGIEKSFETGYAAYLVAETLAIEQFRLGSSVVIDAVNAEEEAKNVWRELAKKQDALLIIIECALSDKELHKKRIEARTRNLHGIPEITWERVEDRRKAYTAWKEPTLQIDTLNDLQANVEKTLQYIQGHDEHVELQNELDTFLKAYEQAANSRDFSRVAPFIADDASFWFTNGQFSGKVAIQKAFEDTWANIQDETYTISNVHWAARDSQVATCTYTFKSDGMVDGKRQAYEGHGTNVVRRIAGRWQMVHEHLSK
jgi:predicted kinase/ketosteroid isomerase-like protein